MPDYDVTIYRWVWVTHHIEDVDDEETAIDLAFEEAEQDEWISAGQVEVETRDVTPELVAD